ncbi:MAG: amidohydrolase family protein [Paracoccaceae bacterium]
MTLLLDIIVPGLGRGDLRVADGRVQALEPTAPSDTPRIVLPALVEAHCHLDKCHTLHRLPDVGGDLATAVARQWADKVNWTDADIRGRASRGLDELRAAGCGLVRSHVDWGMEAAPPPAWFVLAELAQETPDLTLELASLAGLDRMGDPEFAEPVARAVRDKNGVLGTMILGHPDPMPALRRVFALADRLGHALDFHVDEGLEPGPCNLEAIADAALETGFQGPVLCGHACAMMNLGPGDVTRVADKLARAGIHVAALPTTNLYLQGRSDGTPDRRGLTRIRELAAAGVSVVVASDNVDDAFCPVGQHDPMAALHLAVLAAHLDPPFERWLPLITDNATRAMGRDPVPVIGASVSDIRISNASSLAELVSGRAGPLTPLHIYLGEHA